MTSENVELRYKGGLLSGWSDVTITRGADKTANGFSLTAARGSVSLTKPAITGEPIEVLANGDLVLTGQIEKYSGQLDVQSGGRILNISGRSKTGILVKSDAQGSFRNMNTLQIIRQLVEEWGIEIETTLTDWVTHDYFTVNTGQKIHEVIHGLLSLQQAAASCTEQGKLRIYSSDQAQSQGGASTSRHIISANVEVDDTERFGEYVAKGQSAAIFSGVQASEIVGKGFDLAATGRRIYFPPPEARSNTLRDNAERAANRSFGKSRSVTLEVGTWRNEAGQIWNPGSKLMVDLPEFDLSQELIIDNVELRHSVDNGTTANLRLIPLEAYKGKSGRTGSKGKVRRTTSNGKTADTGGENVFKTTITGKSS